MKFKYIYILFVILGLTILTNQCCFAQVSINNVMGTKIRNTEGYEGIEGSPYFSIEWLAAKVIFGSGVTGEVEFARYDLILDQLFFSNAKKIDVFAFTEPIRAFTIRGAVFQNNFPATGNFNKDNFFQVIGKAKFSLLKKEENIVSERTAVGTPSIRYFQKIKRYYVYDGNKLITVKPDSKSISAALNLKKEDLDNYIKENKLNIKDDSDLKLIFEYFAK